LAQLFLLLAFLLQALWLRQPQVEPFLLCVWLVLGWPLGLVFEGYPDAQPIAQATVRVILHRSHWHCDHIRSVWVQVLALVLALVVFQFCMGLPPQPLWAEMRYLCTVFQICGGTKTNNLLNQLQ
jgi:hypothetical protein